MGIAFAPIHSSRLAASSSLGKPFLLAQPAISAETGPFSFVETGHVGPLKEKHSFFDSNGKGRGLFPDLLQATRLVRLTRNRSRRR